MKYKVKNLYYFNDKEYLLLSSAKDAEMVLTYYDKYNKEVRVMECFYKNRTDAQKQKAKDILFNEDIKFKKLLINAFWTLFGTSVKARDISAVNATLHFYDKERKAKRYTVINVEEYGSNSIMEVIK